MNGNKITKRGMKIAGWANRTYHLFSDNRFNRTINVIRVIAPLQILLIDNSRFLKLQLDKVPETWIQGIKIQNGRPSRIFWYLAIGDF